MIIMPMKIQPIEEFPPPTDVTPAVVAAVVVVVKPVVKSRLRRLFRISVEKDGLPPPQQQPPPTQLAAAVTVVVPDYIEPSSICLGKMVQNFIEENNEKQSHTTKCGRNRCNCFNGNGSSDGSDGESDNVTSGDVCDYTKSLVVCGSLNERSVLADTSKIVSDKNKICKRKDELRKLVIEELVCLGYDAAICKSKWDKSTSFPAGEYDYMDVIIGGERLIIDIDFRSEFEVARSTKTYKTILQTLPQIFVGKSDRLSKLICILSEAAKQSLEKKGMHIPPWRKADYVQAKWLSPPTRLTTTVPATTVTPPPSPLTPTSSTLVFDFPSKSTPDESELSHSSPRFEPVFEMSESSGEEDVKGGGGGGKDHKDPKWLGFGVKAKAKAKTINGLASIIEDKP